MDSSKSKPLAPIEQRLSHWDDTPAWMQIDPYIRRGYRRQMDSIPACFRSLFYTHNELVNTWSHLLPALLYLGAMIGVEWELISYHHLRVQAEETEEQLVVVRREDVMTVHLYLMGTVGCLLASAFFHVSTAHSEAMAKRLLKLDYMGICLSICVTNLTSTDFGLSEEPSWQMFYNTLCIICGITLLIPLMRPNSDGPKAAFPRVLAFLALILTGFAPIAHMFLAAGSRGIERFPLFHIICMELCYLTGTIFYLTHWPEKQWPETFDIWGASHQIFHVTVAIGQFVFFLGLRERMGMRYT